METQTALVRSDGAVKLYAETRIDLNLSPIVHPGHAENDLSFRIGDPFQNGVFAELVLVCLHNSPQRFQNFLYCLMELGLRRVFLYNLRDDLINI